jgi:hypothetical protein
MKEQHIIWEKMTKTRVETNYNNNLSVKEDSHVSFRNWTFLGYDVPKPEIYIVDITTLINVAISNGDTTVWISWIHAPKSIFTFGPF